MFLFTYVCLFTSLPMYFFLVLSCILTYLILCLLMFLLVCLFVCLFCQIQKKKKTQNHTNKQKKKRWWLFLYADNSDLIACMVVSKDGVQAQRFLAVDVYQMSLVEPETKRLGWGVVKFAGLLQVNSPSVIFTASLTLISDQHACFNGWMTSQELKIDEEWMFLDWFPNWKKRK